MPRLGAAFLALTLAAAAAPPARAQEHGGTPGQFDYYVLALSWSPSFCEGAGGRRPSRQCDPGRHLGFVVHGLWPQYERGYPSACSAQERFLPRTVLDEADGVFPDFRLARYEWRQHGTCSGLGPREYFQSVRAARDRVRIPEALTAPETAGQTTSQNLVRAFVDANPGLRPDMISLECRGGALSEVRVCLNRDLRGFRPCSGARRPSCGFGPLRVPAPN